MQTFKCSKCGLRFTKDIDKQFIPCQNSCGGIASAVAITVDEVPLDESPKFSQVEATIDGLMRSIGKKVSEQIHRACIDCWRAIADDDPGGMTLDGYWLCGKCAMNDKSALKMLMVQIPATGLPKSRLVHFQDGDPAYVTKGGFVVLATDNEMELVDEPSQLHPIDISD